MNQQPTPEEISAVLDKVSAVAAMADVRLERHPHANDMLVAGFDMGGGRSQQVFIRYIGQTPDGHDCISFMSPCQEIKKSGLLGGGISKGKAMELLRRNAVIPFGSYALYTFDRQEVLMVSSNQIVGTMEVEEFKTHVQYVALVADRHEQEIGKDQF